MTAFLIILAIVLFIVAYSLHRSANKSEERYRNRPSVISNPSKDLLSNEKYAIVKLFAFVQGASIISTCSSEANQIAQEVISSLGMSRSEVERVINMSMRNNPDVELRRMINSLKEIRDRNYLKVLKNKCSIIAEISENPETVYDVENIFQELGIY